MHFYDIYLSVGCACRPAYHLLANDLRNEAYPLDWQMAYSLDTVIHLFQTKFTDFFIDIKEADTTGSRNCRRIIDKKNDITSIHHFSKDIELLKAQELFLQKMNKRFLHLEQTLLNSKKLVLICNRTDTLEKLETFLQNFSLIYPHLEIKLINIRNNEDMSSDSFDSKKYIINDILSIEEYSFNDTFNSITNETFDWHGNEKMWNKVLKSYYTTNNLTTIQEIKAISKNFVIYGAGRRCLSLLTKFEKYGIQIKGIAVTDTLNNPKSIGQYSVHQIEQYDKTDCIVISFADQSQAEETSKKLIKNGYYNLYFLNKYLQLEKI